MRMPAAHVRACAYGRCTRQGLDPSGGAAGTGTDGAGARNETTPGSASGRPTRSSSAASRSARSAARRAAARLGSDGEDDDDDDDETPLLGGGSGGGSGTVVVAVADTSFTGADSGSEDGDDDGRERGGHSGGDDAVAPAAVVAGSAGRLRSALMRTASTASTASLRSRVHSPRLGYEGLGGATDGSAGPSTGATSSARALRGLQLPFPPPPLLPFTLLGDG